MKKIILAVLILIYLSIASYCQVVRIDSIPIYGGGIEKVLIEVNEVDPVGAENDTNLSPDAYCYRVFLDLLSYSYSATDSVRWSFLACGASGDGESSLKIESTESFYNNEDFGTDIGTSIITNLLPIYPELFYDSYAADGRIGSNHVGVLRSVNENGYIPITEGSTPAHPGVTVPAAIPVLSGNATSGYIGPDGWYVPAGISGPDTSANIVFIGQFTTAGDFTFTFNISTLGVKRYIPETGKISARYETKYIIYPYSGVPVVTITSPNNNDQFINEVITIEADATDSDGTVSLVVFYVDGVEIGSDDSEPYQIEWTVTEGEHIITAIVTDNNGFTGNSLPVTIYGPGTSIEDTYSKEVKLFPNPSYDGIYYLQVSGTEFKNDACYSVYDLQGSHIEQVIIPAGSQSNTITVDLSQFSNGIYLFKLTIDGISYSELLVRQ